MNAAAISGSDRTAGLYGKLPLLFARNAGQFAGTTRFLAQDSGLRCSLETNRIRMLLFRSDWTEAGDRDADGVLLDVRFERGRGDTRLEGIRPEAGRAHYFRGGDPAAYTTGVDLYRGTAYRELWPGIDLEVQGGEGRLKFDWLLRPGAQAADIRLVYDGADDVRLDEDGDLLLTTPYGILTDRRPVAYQPAASGERIGVPCRYTVEALPDGGWRIGFETPEGYDRTLPLVIDPVIEYSTYLGGTGTESGNAVAVDAAGHAYVTGSTLSVNFPVTPGAFQTTLQGDIDGFVAKLNPTGTALVYSTILGGTQNDDINGIAIDDAGNAYVTGQSTSADFPTTPGSFVTPLGIRRAFVTKLNPTGTELIYSALLGGDASNTPFAIAVNSAREAVVTGNTTSSNYPVTPDAFQPFRNGTDDAFVTVLDSFGSSLVYSTYLGGGSTDIGNGVAVDPADSIYVTGQTFSFDYPVTPGAFQTVRQGIDAFVTKFGNRATLDLVKFADRFEMRPGEHVTFFVELKNGGVPITNVFIEDPFLGFFLLLPELAPFEARIFPLAFIVSPQQPPGLVVNQVFVRADQLPGGLEAEAVVLVAEEPSLSAVKSVSPAAAAPGETVTFTILLFNQGNTELLNVRIVDELLGIEQSIGHLPVGASFRIDWPFEIPPGQQVGLTIANVAEITADNLPGPERIGVAVEVLPAPRLDLSKTGDRISVVPGETVQFTLEIANTGNVALTNVRIADDTIGSEFEVPVLGIGETKAFPIPFLVPLETPPQTYTNTAIATSVEAPSATASFDVLVLAAPQIGIRKLPSVTTASPGQSLQYSIVLDNIGNVPLTRIELNDPLLAFARQVPALAVGERLEFLVPFTIPADAAAGSDIVNELTVGTAEAGTRQVQAAVAITPTGLAPAKTADRAVAAPGDTISYVLTVTNRLDTAQTNVVLSDPLLGLGETIPTLAAGASVTRTGTFAVPADAANGSVVTNRFVVSSDQTPPQTATDEVVVVSDPGAATTLVVDKLPDRSVAAPGETVRYTVTVANVGANPATGVIIVDSLTGATAAIPAIAPGAAAIVELGFEVPATALQGTTFANRVTVDWTENPTATPAISETRIVVALPATLLELAVTAAPSTARPGATVAKTIRITNVSDRTLTDVPNRTLTNIRVIDVLLGFSTVISALAPGEARVFTLPFTVPATAAGGETFRNNVIVFSDQSPLQQAAVDIVTESLPDALLTETVDRPIGRPGEVVHFAITLRNTGNVALRNGLLTAPLLNLAVRIEQFDIGAEEIVRVPFTLPETEEDIVLASPVSFVSDNGPPRFATASVRVVGEEEE